MKKLLVLLLVVWLTQAACEDDGRRPAKIYVPKGYVGWVRIEYGVPGAPALKKDLFGPWEYWHFTQSGLIQTSSRLEQGAASTDSYYYSQDESLESIPREMQHEGLINWCVKKPDGERLERDFITFFIGPGEEYERRKEELEQFRKGDCRYVIPSFEALPKVGNIRR